MITIKFVVPLNMKNITSKEIKFDETEAGHLATVAMALDWLKAISQDCHDFDVSLREDKRSLVPKDQWQWFKDCGWLWDKATMPFYYTVPGVRPRPSRPYAKSSGMMAMPEAETGGLMPSPKYSEEPDYEPMVPLAQAAGAVPSVTDMKFLNDLITKNISMSVSGSNAYGEAEKDLEEVIKVLKDGVHKATGNQLAIRVHAECKDDGEQRSIICLHTNCPKDLPGTPVSIVAFGLSPKGYPIKVFAFDEYDVFSSGVQICNMKDKAELCKFVLGLTEDDGKGRLVRCISVEAVNMLRRMDQATAASIQKTIDDLNEIPVPKKEK